MNNRTIAAFSLFEAVVSMALMSVLGLGLARGIEFVETGRIALQARENTHRLADEILRTFKRDLRLIKNGSTVCPGKSVCVQATLAFLEGPGQGRFATRCEPAKSARKIGVFKRDQSILTTALDGAKTPCLKELSCSKQELPVVYYDNTSADGTRVARVFPPESDRDLAGLSTAPIAAALCFKSGLNGSITAYVDALYLGADKLLHLESRSEILAIQNFGGIQHVE